MQTVHGIIQGQTVISKDGRYSHQYLGIPYASPPIGRLRFQKPKPYTGQWSGKRTIKILTHFFKHMIPNLQIRDCIHFRFQV